MSKSNNPNHRDNLKPFQSGDDSRRNLNGRPPKLPKLEDLMAKVLGEEKNGQTAAERILAKMEQLAASGNIKAAELLLDRGYGKAKQTIDQNIEFKNRPEWLDGIE